MSTVFLSSVDSSSKLDSYTGLPTDDGLSATKSTPLLLEGITVSPTDYGLKRIVARSPLLDEVLRKGSLRPTSSLGDLEGLEDEDLQHRTSFADLLQSRDLGRDQSWMDTQVRCLFCLFA